jgi:hypothetical protein
VWLIFDELDYHLLYDGLERVQKTPSFDRLRKESFFATHATACAGETLIAIPSLLEGHSASHATSTSSGNLAIFTTDGSPTIVWGEHSTDILHCEAAKGFVVGVLGWYHPYDLLFANCTKKVFSQPLWRYSSVGNKSFFGAVTRQWFSGFPLVMRYLYIEHAKTARRQLRELLADRSIDLVFAHLPMPHPPAIFNPNRGAYYIFPELHRGGYESNLGLADEVLGDVFAQLSENQNDGRSTTLLVSSDHWFRKAKQIDTRVPWAIWSPSKIRPREFTNAFNTVVSRRIVEGLLDGSLDSKNIEQAIIGN